jgi:6-pyruvoyltetrahydropterin/6-carboxytetrahydropterin synthase
VYELTVKTNFSAAHHLRGYAGKCSEQHGHNWEVEVSIRGERLNRTGILLDFRVLKRMVKGLLDGLDHTDLNKHRAFKKANPTSEAIAKFLFECLSKKLTGTGCNVSRVVVRETPETSASYSSLK